jgi:4-carboxymuconolactone decarboxylase
VANAAGWNQRNVSAGAYREAEALLGPDGIMDIVMLTGIYHSVCAILNTFEIPAPS